MRPARREFIALIAAVTTICGCTPTLSKGKLSLAPAQMSPDSVGLELFFVRCPFGDPDVNTKLWQEIDEQHLPADLRERLARNGFRAGVVSGQVPVELSKLLELSDKPSGAASGSENQGQGERAIQRTAGGPPPSPTQGGPTQRDHRFQRLPAFAGPGVGVGPGIGPHLRQRRRAFSRQNGSRNPMAGSVCNSCLSSITIRRSHAGWAIRARCGSRPAVPSEYSTK